MSPFRLFPDHGLQRLDSLQCSRRFGCLPQLHCRESLPRGFPPGPPETREPLLPVRKHSTDPVDEM